MASLQQQYTRRLQKEFAALREATPSGITLSLVDDNLHLWQAVIPGPQDSPYAGGIFKAQIIIPEEYPLKPPAWSPAATSMEQIVNALFSLLARPEPQNSMDHELLNQYTHYRANYERDARRSVRHTPR